MENDGTSNQSDIDWLNGLASTYPSFAGPNAQPAMIPPSPNGGIGIWPPPGSTPGPMVAPNVQTSIGPDGKVKPYVPPPDPRTFVDQSGQSQSWPVSLNAQGTLPPLSPNMHKLLDVIAGPESAGEYNVRYGGAGGAQHFTDYSAHPNVHVAIPGSDGLTSSAAGRYQMITPTWQEAQQALGLKDFSPGSQDQAAAYIASKTYKDATGRDLETDLQDPTKFAAISSALHGQWGTLSDKNIAVGMNMALPPSATPSGPPTMMAANTPPPQAPALTADQIQQNKLQQLAQLQSSMKPIQTVALANPYAASQPWSTGNVGVQAAHPAANSQQQMYAMQRQMALANNQLSPEQVAMGYSGNPLQYQTG